VTVTVIIKFCTASLQKKLDRNYKPGSTKTPSKKPSSSRYGQEDTRTSFCCEKKTEHL